MGGVKEVPAGADAGVDSVKRIDIKCDHPPTPEPSKTASVPAGPFTMGCNADVDTECRSDEKPEHTVTLDAFEIDITEVTQGQYYECVAAGACRSPACDWDPCADGKKTNYPVSCIDHTDAMSYCAWKGMRLPTEAEWEKAARGTDGRKYPWGNTGLDCQHANFAGCGLESGHDGTLPPGSLPLGASPYGVMDMAGNVAEWVSDYYDATYYATSPSTDPKGPANASAYIGRGGGFRSTGVWERTSQRDDYEVTYVKNSGGFRCAK